MKNKIIITGASRGIGKDICISLLQKNFNVLCLSRKKPSIKNKNLKFKSIDLSNLNKVKKLESIIRNFKPDHLICNAGDLGEIGKIDKINVDSWIKSFNLNLFSHVILTKLCMNNIKKSQGRIIFLAGGGSANSFPGFSAYSVAKTALVRFVENLADENKEIISTIISPGPILTDLMKKSFDHGHHVSKKRIMKTNKCIELIIYLLKNKKKFLSGKFIHSKDNYKNFTAKNISGRYLLRRTDDRN